MQSTRISQVCTLCQIVNSDRRSRRHVLLKKGNFNEFDATSFIRKSSFLAKTRRSGTPFDRHLVVTGFSRISAAYVAGYLDSMQTTICPLPLRVVVSSRNPEELQAMRVVLGGIGSIELHQDHSAWSSVLGPSLAASWVIQNPEECRALLHFMKEHCLLRSWEAHRLLRH